MSSEPGGPQVLEWTRGGVLWQGVWPLSSWRGGVGCNLTQPARHLGREGLRAPRGQRQGRAWDGPGEQPPQPPGSLSAPGCWPEAGSRGALRATSQTASGRGLCGRDLGREPTRDPAHFPGPHTRLSSLSRHSDH